MVGTKILKILVVEDSDVIRRITVLKLVNLFDSEIDEANDGDVALEMVQKKSYDIIVSDNEMPHMDGMEFIKKAQKYTSKTLKVMCSGLDVKDIGMDKLNSIFDSGFDIFVPKPFDPLAENFYKSVIKKFNPKLQNDEKEWVKEAYDLCDELNPESKDKFLKEIAEIERVIYLMVVHEVPFDKNMYRLFHSIKGILSYFNDDLMDEAYYFDILKVY